MREDVAAEVIDLAHDLEDERAAMREIERLVWAE